MSKAVTHRARRVAQALELTKRDQDIYEMVWLKKMSFYAIGNELHLHRGNVKRAFDRYTQRRTKQYAERYLRASEITSALLDSLIENLVPHLTADDYKEKIAASAEIRQNVTLQMKLYGIGGDKLDITSDGQSFIKIIAGIPEDAI